MFCPKWRHIKRPVRRRSRLAGASWREKGGFWGREMNRPRPFSPWINPRFDHLQDEEVVFGHQPSIHHLAFQAGITLGDKRRFDDPAGHGCEAKGLELVHV